MIADLSFFHHTTRLRRIFAALLASFVVAAGVFFASSAFAADPNASNDTRLVTIHDATSEVSVVTRGATVADALEQAGVEVADSDIVEPAASTTLVAKSYQVNIFRARPVTVVDGATKVSVMTAEQSPRFITKQAGVKLYDEDKTKFERVDDVLGEGGVGLRLVIDRATQFTLNLYGKQFTARTQASTVGDMMKEKNITLGKDDGISVPLSTPIAKDTYVRIWRNGKQTVTQEETIARPVEEVKDADKPLGFREVRTEGADGKRNVTYEVETQSGVEVARREIASVTTLEPVKQVVVVGTKVVLPPGSHTDWMAAAGIAASDYGYVEHIVARESGWGVTKSNYTGSGAYGLCQALPGSKMASAGSDWATNPITQLRWCDGYAKGRYGSWARAYDFWVSNHWW